MDVVRQEGRRSGAARRRLGALGVAAATLLGLVASSAPASAASRAIHWTQMTPATSPAARYGATLAYDAAHQDVVMFGGVDSGGNPRNDTWVWNGSNWKKMSPATSPPARIYHFMAYDSTHRDVLLFGGVTTTWVNDTWTWDGTNWTEQHPTTSPTARAGFGGISDDPADGGVLLFGGYDQTTFYYDTWRWTGTNWVQVTTSAHPTGYGPALAISTAAGGIVAFGDGDTTWLFGGSDWVQVFPPTGPPARFANGMASAGKGAVVFGGGDFSGGFLDDTWNFNGTTWAQLSATGPSARGYISLALDKKHRNIVLFGGLDANGRTFGDTWTLGP